MNAAPLNGKALGHPCARLSCDVPSVSTPARHAHSCAQRRGTCSLVCATLSFMPILFGCHRAMLNHVRNAITHAHLAATPSRMLSGMCNAVVHAHLAATPSGHAQWCAQRDSVSKREAQQPHVADAARGERDRSFFER